MSLLVWLPLNGNLNNYGISTLKFSVVTTNTTVNNSGKTGRCYGNNSNTAGGIVSNTAINLGDNISMFCWVKLNSFFASSNLTGILGLHRYGSNLGMGITMKYLSSTTGKLSLNTGNGSGRTYNTYTGNTTLNSNTWYHVGFTYTKSTGIINFYVNGVHDGTATYANQKNVADYIQLFGWSFSSGTTIYNNYMLNGYLNDVRIYDHVLSIKEIKEISKGLVIHYTFNDPYIENCTNLFNSISSVNAKLEKYENGIKVLTTSGDAYAGISLKLSLVSGITYLISFDVLMNESDTCYFGLYYNSRMNHIIQLHNGRNIMEVVPTLNLSSLTFDDSTRTNDNPIYITNFQIELNDHATPYSGSGRTVTTITDNSGFGNTGTITGTLSCLSNSARGSYCTNLVNSYVSTTLYPFPETTISFWINRNAQTGTRQFIYTGWYGISIELSNSNGWQVYYTYNSSGSTVRCSPTTILNANLWYHCAFVIGTAGVKFYINGVCEATATYQTPYYTASIVQIGNYSSYKNFNAKLSDFRIYCTALSETDIANLYKDSLIIDNILNLYCYELNETETGNKFKKSGIIQTDNILELYEYLYLPSGKYVNTKLYYEYNDLCKAETTVRYEADGSGRDLMGYSGTASGYWGVKATGVLEPHGTFSYTNADITEINKIIFTYAGSNDHGYYQIGALSGGYSTRNKFIYHTKLWKNGTLERDLYPASINGQVGLFDVIYNIFYPVTGTGATVSNEVVNIRIQNDNSIITNNIMEI